MTKYIIELEDDIKYLVINGRADNRCYTLVRPVAELEMLNSDYINEHFGSLQDEAYKRGFEDGNKSGYEKGLNAVGTYRKGHAIGYDEGYEDGKNSYDKNKTYQRGLNDAWEAARRIVVDTDHGGLALGTLSGIFGTQSYSYIMRENTVQEAIAKLKAYEDKPSDRIEVGDIVDRYIDGKFDSRGIYLGGNGEIWDCLFWANTLPITLAYPKGQFKKTGKHYDIQSILEAMRK